MRSRPPRAAHGAGAPRPSAPRMHSPRIPAALRGALRIACSCAGTRRCCLWSTLRGAARQPCCPAPGCALIVTSRQSFVLGTQRLINLNRLTDADAASLLRMFYAPLTDADAAALRPVCWPATGTAHSRRAPCNGCSENGSTAWLLWGHALLQWQRIACVCLTPKQRNTRQISRPSQRPYF